MSFNNKYLILFFFNRFCLNIMIQEINLSSYNITIKIKGIGYQKIVNDNCPNKIYDNEGILIYSNECKINLTNEENIITMEWDKELNANSLFKDLTSILEVDLLSKIDLLSEPVSLLYKSL